MLILRCVENGSHMIFFFFFITDHILTIDGRRIGNFKIYDKKFDSSITKGIFNRSYFKILILCFVRIININESE